MPRGPCLMPRGLCLMPRGLCLMQGNRSGLCVLASEESLLRPVLVGQEAICETHHIASVLCIAHYNIDRDRDMGHTTTGDIAVRTSPEEHSDDGPFTRMARRLEAIIRARRTCLRPHALLRAMNIFWSYFFLDRCCVVAVANSDRRALKPNQFVHQCHATSHGA